MNTHFYWVPLRLPYALASLVVLTISCGDNVTMSRAELLNPETCAGCHPTHYREWQNSMHAYAADDPVFIAMNQRGQRETNGELGDFCVQCHAPMAVREGLTTDGLNLSELPQEVKGVTCYFCHNVDAVAGTHNNPLRLANDTVMRGGFSDAVGNSAHNSAYSPLHDGNNDGSSPLCGACHDIVTPRGVHLERTFTEWQESVFSRAPFSLSCNECHMPSEDGLVADFPGVGRRERGRHPHSWPGVDIAITPWPGIAEQSRQINEFLATTVQAQLCYVPGLNVMRLSLTNIGAGHQWPSGSAHDRRAWVELVATVGDDNVIETGVIAADETVAETNDALLWQIRDFAQRDDGSPAPMFWDVAKVETALLPPALELNMNHSVVRDFALEGNPRPDRATVRVQLRPMGLDVIDDLIASGDLAPSIRDRFPTWELEGASLLWTPALADLGGCVD